ncbi:MAG TPA: VOC family protein [Mycobacteriales bacterium]|jgi:predicted enzyme related to lactoylglutathione lyase|nr:VOC family protein [Mycobacteriales bacterium]
MSERQPDPLQALRTPTLPVAPDREFARALRARLERALLAPITQEEVMPEVLRRDELSRHGTQAGDVSYIALAVPDAGLARAFYGSVLGWRFAPGHVEQQGNQVDAVIPQVGLAGGAAPASAGAVLGFRVDDLAAAVATVRARGGDASDPRREPYGLVADCHDDQGLAFFLHELAAPGSPAPMNGIQHGDISYVSLQVTDPDRARDFFGPVLGWTFSPGHAAGGSNVEGPTPMIGLGGDRSGRPGAILCYRVDDIAAAVGHIRLAGGSATDPVQRPYALESDCTDDQGIRFYLHQFAD